MAEIPYQEGDYNGIDRAVFWQAIRQGDTCAWYKDGREYPDKCVHIFGTLDGGGMISLKGSNEVTPIISNPATLKSTANELIEYTNLTNSQLEQIAANPGNIAPQLSSGGVATNVDVYLWLKR